MSYQYRYTFQELEALPTLAIGQADDLKIDTGKYRVWLSRCDTTDGEPYDNKVTIERYNEEDGRWKTIDEYQAESEEEEWEDDDEDLEEDEEDDE